MLPDAFLSGRKVKVKRPTEESERAFAYWVSLGKGRSYKLVAQRFNVSVETVKAWAVSFNWRQRLAETLRDKDALFLELLGEIHDVRKKAVLVVFKIHEWYDEMTKILDGALREKRPYTKEELELIGRYRFAIESIDSKVLKNLIAYFDASVNFDASKQTEQAMANSVYQFNGPMFVIKEGSSRLSEAIEAGSSGGGFIDGGSSEIIN